MPSLSLDDYDVMNYLYLCNFVSDLVYYCSC